MDTSIENLIPRDNMPKRGTPEFDELYLKIFHAMWGSGTSQEAGLAESSIQHCASDSLSSRN